ncbi:MAG: hypothetical protein ACRD29_15085 [Acidimicrobiales bacterium]
MPAAATLAESRVRLRAWAGEVVADVATGHGPPTEIEGDPLVGFYLLGLVPAHDVQGGDTSRTFWFRARYLVTTRAADPEAANDLLERLLVAASETDGFEPKLDSMDQQMWLALGVPSRPAFLLELPIRHEREREPAPLVLFPLNVRESGLRPLSGQLLGPGDVPLVGAVVGVADVAGTAQTGPTGEFRFPLVPTEPSTKRLRVQAKGREFIVDVDLDQLEEGLVIRCDPREA